LVVNAALFGAHYFCLLMLINVCSVQVLSDMEGEFARFIQFLSSMINKVTLRGTFPHCMFCINVSHSSLFSLLSETINIVGVFFSFCLLLQWYCQLFIGCYIAIYYFDFIF